MRHLTQTKLYVETKEALSLGGLSGVHDLKVDGHSYTFQVDTDNLDQVMKYVSESGIVKIESAKPTLEDLFMRHYEGETGGAK